MANNNNLELNTLQFIGETLGTADFEVIPLAGDASSRRYYRILHGQLTYVLMAWEKFDPQNFPFLNVLEHFKKHRVQVPLVIGMAPKLGLVILEDLGDLTLERKFWEYQNQDYVIPYYKMAVDELLKIHYPATQDSNSDCSAFKIEFNTEKLLWEMNYGLEHLILKLCKVPLSNNERDEITDVFKNICGTLDREEKLICHRDYHSRNIMMKLNRARIIDFQDARMGTAQYDLVSLVFDSYVDLNDQSRSEILEYYLARATEFKSTSIDRNHFFEIMRIQTIQRCFKACGSFASFFNMREDRRYLKYLGPTISRVVKTLEQYPEYRAFLEVLLKYKIPQLDFLNPEVSIKSQGGT